mmetsp:Transcript_10904/g.22831  ORF Transcript_10904/g.22831 Transcript_10904/m.22831 type:complete len:265 (-) Transcript_10904:797-1591(-)
MCCWLLILIHLQIGKTPHILHHSRISHHELLKSIRESIKGEWKCHQVSHTKLEVLIMILHVLCCTLLSSANVHFITLESSNLLVSGSKHPCTRADASRLKEQTPTQEHIHQRVGQERKRKRRCHKLPRNGTQNCCDHSTKQTRVEEALHTIRHSKDVRVRANLNLQGGHSRNHKEAQGHTQLTPNHETCQVVRLAAEQKVTSHHRKLRLATLTLGQLRNSKERNLHTLKQTNTTHQHKEQNHTNSRRKTLPNGGLLVEQSLKSH